MSDLTANLHQVQHRIADAAMRAGRDPNDITLIAVSKTFRTEAVVAAHELGLRNFGENRVEEAAEKIPQVNAQILSAATAPTPSSFDSAQDAGAEARTADLKKITWHLVGHLQSRKVKDAVALFDCIHSIDSVELAERIEKRATELNKTISVLLEINVSGEASKSGFAYNARTDFFNAAEKILALPNLNVVGLMTIAPIVQRPDDARPHFAALRVLRDELQARHPSNPLPHLSTGMTDDFEAAIAEGATMVRIGRAIFGERK